MHTDGKIMKSLVLDLLREKLNYFKAFSEITKLREAVGQKAQFKTERWFQAELLVFIHSKGIKVIPEYGMRRWDSDLSPLFET